MIEFIKKRKYLKCGITVSILLHIMCVIFLNFFYKQEQSNQIPLTNKKISVNLTSVYKLPPQSTSSSVDSSQKKFNNIKILEKVPDTSSHQSTSSSVDSSQKKKAPAKITKQNVKRIKQHHNSNIPHTYKSDIHDLLSKLTNNTKILEFDNNLVKYTQDNFHFDKNIEQSIKKSHNEIDAYKKILTQTISNTFRKHPNHFGKQCILHVNLLSDGTLSNITCSNPSSPLCQAAVLAIQSVKIPPPNLEVYETCKNITLNFSS